MIHKLTLKCFRQHEDRTFTFTEGLNVIKGANERGKTTIVEAILYALFGSKALRETLASVVTWGRKESDLFVELTLTLNGKLIKFSRSKSGAESTHEGGTVVGQTEVSNFAAELLGGDLRTVNNLMLANQNDLRGALEEGPKAVAVQIEQLADFNLFDNILTAASENLVLGPVSSIDSRIANIESKLIEPQVPDYSSIDVQIANRQDSIKALEAKLSDRSELHMLTHELTTIKQHNQRAMEHKNSLKSLDEKIFAKVQEVNDGKLAANVESGFKHLHILQDGLEKAKNHEKISSIYSEFLRLKFPDVFWEGDADSYHAEIARMEKEKEHWENKFAESEDTLSKVKSLITMEKAKIISSLTCPTCGQDFKDKVRLQEENEKRQVSIAKLEKEVKGLESRLKLDRDALFDRKEELKLMRGLQRVAEPFTTLIRAYPDYISSANNTYPPKPQWIGEPPTKGASVSELRGQIAAIELAEKNRVKAEARLESDLKYLADLQNQRQSLEEIKLEPMSASEVEARLRVVQYNFDHMDAQVRDDRIQLDCLTSERKKLEWDYKSKLESLQNLKSDLDSAKLEREELIFNNQLVKRIREVRPIVSDKLWAMVLASVSQVFSQMRGEVSSVTKGSDGFRVNGNSVAGLSGSTLDILGLAIRISLIKTFLPGSSLLVLDEPAHGCDEARTAALLASISTAGFKQTLVISHEEAAEAVADHLIEV